MALLLSEQTLLEVSILLHNCGTIEQLFLSKLRLLKKKNSLKLRLPIDLQTLVCSLFVRFSAGRPERPDPTLANTLNTLSNLWNHTDSHFHRPFYHPHICDQKYILTLTHFVPFSFVPGLGGGS